MSFERLDPAMIGGMVAAAAGAAAQAELAGCRYLDVHDVCAIIVSHNGKHWLDAALTSLFTHMGEISLDVVVVDNGSDGSAEYVEARFPGVRTMRCPNRGFGHANNQALETADARYVLFINPDTEVLEGSLSSLVAALDRRPEVGLAGARQLRDDGSLAPSIRRFPSASNMVAEALGIERMPGARRMLGERELDEREYDRERDCDWTSGSFMLARKAALDDSGWFDERFFLFSEETDLCWRLKQDGWEVVHMPWMTIRHHEHDGQENARLEAQAAYSRMQFARKHFPRRAAGYRRALALRYGLRVGAYSLLGRSDDGRPRAARAALETVRNGKAPYDTRSAV